MKLPFALVLPVLLSFTSGPVYADYFQIFEGGRQNYFPYAQVYVGGKLYGYTDLYGRIKVDLPKGRYAGQVELRGGTRKRIEFTIDGGRQLKRVNAQ
ncbi:hypothetical protein LP416_01730 [Polaromonas sp. P2-4]|nr:hypothetical protein LP416_01730 [Polaromonas sp. P2-4]